jgi:ACS family hexuronate transporter-like MFS transporter
MVSRNCKGNDAGVFQKFCAPVSKYGSLRPIQEGGYMASATELRNTSVRAADHNVLTMRTWLPCLGMAFASWLSFVDRQVLAVLAPTILMDTGMTAQDYGNVVFCFFIAYTIGSPLWGSILDFVGLRTGMLVAVALWSAASASHALMGGVAGFGFARLMLGLCEGATFPGGLKTAVETLPADRRGRGIAVSFSGGTIGAIVTPLIVVPIGLQYGWRTAFVLSGALGALWVLVWLTICRPAKLPGTGKARKMAWPNPFEIRFWTLISSYSMTAISPGLILAIFPLYFNRALGVSQAELGRLLWMQPAAWGIGYFCWGWLADKFASENPRPVGLMITLAVFAAALGVAPWTESVSMAMLLTSWSCFVAGGFQMVALKASSLAYSADRAAMMSGIATGSWSLLTAFMSPMIGRMFDLQQWSQAFWLVALFPSVGVAVWLVLTTVRPPKPATA